MQQWMEGNVFKGIDGRIGKILELTRPNFVRVLYEDGVTSQIDAKAMFSLKPLEIVLAEYKLENANKV